MIKLHRKDAIVALMIAGLAILSWLPRLKGPIDLRWDGGAYYVLGTALAEGKGYRLLSEPGEIQTTLHPPMLPVIVAAHQLALRTSDPLIVGWWLRRSYLVLFAAYAVAVYFMLRIFLSPPYAVMAAMVCLFQLNTVFMSDLCFPEIPFGLATVLFTLCNLKGGERTRRLFTVPLAVISFALRTVGVALLAAWAVESVCQHGLRKGLGQATKRSLIALALILCWTGYIAYVESGREYKSPAYEYQRAGYIHVNVSYAQNIKYKDPFSPELGYASPGDRARRFLGNLTWMPVSLAEAVSTREPLWYLLRTEINQRLTFSLIPSWVVRLIVLLLAALIIGGIGLQLKRRQYFIPFYIIFSLAMVCATPWPSQFNRYLAPLAPFLSLSLFLAVQSAAGWLCTLIPAKPEAVRLGLTGAVALLIFTSQAATLLLLYTKWHQKVAFDAGEAERGEYRLFFYHDEYRAADAGLDWLKGRVKDGDVMAANDPQWAYLRTGIKSVFPPFEMDAGKAQRLLDTVPVKYLIVSEGRYLKYTARVVAEYPTCWRRVYADSIVEKDGEQREGRFEIYERINPQ